MKWFNKNKKLNNNAQQRYTDFIKGKDLNPLSLSGMYVSEENSISVSKAQFCPMINVQAFQRLVLVLIAIKLS